VNTWLNEKKPTTLNDKSVIKPTDTFPDNNLVYRVAHFIQKYRVNRYFQHVPFTIFRALSVPVGYIPAKNGHPQLSKTWKFLFPQKILEKINLKRWTNSFIRYNIQLYFDTALYLSLRNSKNEDYFNPVVGFNHLENAFSQKKGVLIPVIHLGEYLHTVYTLLYRNVLIDEKSKRILVLVLASKENEFLFREQIKKIDNFSAVITTDFKSLQKTVEFYLKKNYCVFLAQDYYARKQLRVPFLYNSKRYNFLTPCPQMLTYLHLNLGCPIIPVTSTPTKNLKFSVVKFLPEINPMTMDISNEDQTLQKEIVKFRNGTLNKKQKYGLISLLINRKLNPYILQYPFLWQGAFLLFDRTELRIRFKNVKSYLEMLKITISKLSLFIQNSYEPGRKDEEIFEKLKSLSAELEELDEDPSDILTLKNKYIEIARLNGKNVFKKVISILLSYQNPYFKQKHNFISRLNSSLNLF
jgi:hypothetical protein